MGAPSGSGNQGLIAAVQSRVPFVGARVLEALSRCPRERFLPTNHPDVYRDIAISTRTTVATQPSLIAGCCELASVKEGDCVLDIGSGTGYQSAILAHLVGASGSVIGVEVEPELVDESARLLSALGLHNASIMHHDASVPLVRRFDAIIAGASVRCLSEAWIEQLEDGGRLVAPMEISPYCQMLTAWSRAGNKLAGRFVVPSRFIPLLGPFAPLFALDPEPSPLPELAVRSASGSHACALLRGRRQQVHLGPQNREHWSGFLFWVLSLARHQIQLDGLTPFSRAGIGEPTGTLIDRDLPTWFGIIGDASVAVLGYEDQSATPRLTITQFGEGSAATIWTQNMWNRYSALGSPEPRQLRPELDFAPNRQEDPNAAELGWASLRYSIAR